jgi:hypothetical protein
MQHILKSNATTTVSVYTRACFTLCISNEKHDDEVSHSTYHVIGAVADLVIINFHKISQKRLTAFRQIKQNSLL